MKNKRYSKKEIGIIKKFYPQEGSLGIQKRIIGRDLDSLRHKAKSLGVTVNKEFAYSKIDMSELITNFNEKSSYLLGLIWGDGHVKVKKRSNTINIRLQENDFKELESFGIFNKFHIYKIKKTIKTWQQMYHASVGHKILAEFLKEHDFEQKSITSPYKILNKIPEEFHSDFFRGWYDADGCSTYLNKNIWRISIAGSYNQDWVCLEYLCKKLNIEYSIQQRIFKKSRGSCFFISKMINVNRFFNFIYKKNVICLSRKYNCYKNAKIRAIEKYSNYICMYNGVYKNHGKKKIKFIARGFNNGKNIYIGTYNTSEEAALAYNKWVIEQKKNYNELNIIGKNFFLDFYGLN